MPIIDSQVHVYAANTPERPWDTTSNWPDHVDGDVVHLVVALPDVQGLLGRLAVRLRFGRFSRGFVCGFLPGFLACGHGYIFLLRSRTSVRFAVTFPVSFSESPKICWRPTATCGMYFSM